MRLEGVSPLWIQLFRKIPWTTRIQDIRNQWRKRSKRARQLPSKRPKNRNQASQKKKIKKAPNNTIHSTPKTIRRVKTKIRMAIKNRRNSVGTTQKPTSTNKIKRMLKVQRTGTSKRGELLSEVETNRSIEKHEEVQAPLVTIKAGLERIDSMPTPSRTMKTGTSAET